MWRIQASGEWGRINPTWTRMNRESKWCVFPLSSAICFSAHKKKIIIIKCQRPWIHPPSFYFSRKKRHFTAIVWQLRELAALRCATVPRGLSCRPFQTWPRGKNQRTHSRTQNFYLLLLLPCCGCSDLNRKDRFRGMWSDLGTAAFA